MAKRAPSDETPYRPLLDPGVISAALTKTATSGPPPSRVEPSIAASKVLDIIRQEPSRPQVKLESSEPASSRRALNQAKPNSPEIVQKFDQEKRILLTRHEAAALDRLVLSLASRLGAQVKLSHILRSLISLVLNAESQIDKRAGEVSLVRPPNGDGKALQRFEQEIAAILGAAMRDAGPLR